MTHKVLHIEMKGICRGCPYLATRKYGFVLYCLKEQREIPELDGDIRAPIPIPEWCTLPDAQEPQPFNIMEEVYR